MHKHLWPLAALPLAAASVPALAQYGQHTDWAYTDRSSPYALHYRPFHFQIEGGPMITQKSAADGLDNGWNAGAGFTWYPSRYIPFGIRADATYAKMGARRALLDAAAAQYGETVDRGSVQRWGGDIDGEIDVPLTPETRIYLLAGVGWYKTETTFRRSDLSPVVLCSWWACAQGYAQTDQVVSRTTGERQFARNAGIGMEVSMGQGASFYVEARYMRIGPSSAHQDFIPVHFGLRF